MKWYEERQEWNSKNVVKETYYNLYTSLMK